MNVVIVDEELPYPANSGKRIRTLNLTLQLAKRHKITYVCHRNADSAEAKQAEEFFNDHGITTILVERAVPSKSGPAFYARLLGNLFSPLPYSVQVHTSRELTQAIQRHAETNAVDLWHCEWTPYGQSLCGVVDAPWVVMAHNVESLIWQRYHETESNPIKRWYIKHQWHKFERFEQEMFAKATQTITVSEADAVLARKRFGSSRLRVVDNGVDIEYFHPGTSERDSKRILFLGSLDWRPNLDGVQVLLDDIFPKVLDRHPSARLDIVGRKPPKWLVERAKLSANVELHADVPDIRPYLWECGVLAVPLRIGGGSRLKILEALSARCPVVSTKIGAEGLHLVPEKHYVETDGTEDMAEALLRCIDDPQAISEMTQFGHAAVVKRYNWPVLADKLEAVWKNACCGKN